MAAWVVIGSEAIGDSEINRSTRKRLPPELKLIRELLSAYFAEHKRSQKNLAQLAGAVMSLVEGAFHLSRSVGEAMPRNYASESAFQLVERFLRAEPKAVTSAD